MDSERASPKVISDICPRDVVRCPEERVESVCSVISSEFYQVFGELVFGYLGALVWRGFYYITFGLKKIWDRYVRTFWQCIEISSECQPKFVSSI